MKWDKENDEAIRGRMAQRLIFSCCKFLLLLVRRKPHMVVTFATSNLLFNKLQRLHLWLIYQFTICLKNKTNTSIARFTTWMLLLSESMKQLNFMLKLCDSWVFRHGGNSWGVFLLIYTWKVIAEDNCNGSCCKSTIFFLVRMSSPFWSDTSQRISDCHWFPPTV